MDLAEAKVDEAKGWGFSAYEAESTLKSAREALENNEFEDATNKAKAALDMAANIRDRHRSSLALLTAAKEELERGR